MARKVTTGLSWFAAIAAIACGAFSGANQDTLQSPPTAAIGAIFILGLLVAILVNKPAITVTFAAIVGVGLISLVRILEDSQTLGSSELFIESLFLCFQVVLVLSLTYLLRRRLKAQAANVLIDGIIVGLGAWVLVWIFLIQPSLDLVGNSTSATTVQSIALGMAMVVLFLLATLLFSNSHTSTPSAFLGLAISLGLTGVILRSIVVGADSRLSPSTINATFLIAIGLTGAGLMHPDIRHIASASSMRHTPPLMARLITTTASLIVPIIALAITDPQDLTDRTVRTISVVVLAIFVMTRVIQAVRLNASTQNNLVRNALTDSLTGLPNRILMLEVIEKALAHSSKTNQRPTVLFIDVDRFKSINDSLGHSTGDIILTEVARRLTMAVPSHATVARIAGDEFVVLDTTTESPTQSVMLAEQILDALRDPMKSTTGDMFVTASIGVAYAVQNLKLTADDLMQHADTAMYRAKSAGRNCIALFDESMLESVARRLDVETALYRALERHELHLVHQPIVDINLGVVVGFEALMRWDRGESGVVSPLDFIPIAEETGTIVPLGSWAINDALQQLRSWIDTGICTANTTMSVNVSPRQLHDPEFVTVVQNALSASGVSAEQLWLEVTESVMITEPTQALSSLRRLNALGVRIAIDDFGTGYSSLSLLQKFPIQCIKIDKAFVNHIDTEEGTQNIVRTIIAMADAMGAEIVAEGIENKEQLRTLVSLNCLRAQGYLISRPVEVHDVPRVVRQIEDTDYWNSLTN